MRKYIIIPLAVFTLLGPSLAQAVLLDYWPMDEQSGNVANPAVGGDLAVWQNDGQNLSWVPGKFGNAADLGGQNAGENYFKVDLSRTLSGANGLTISMWVNPDGFSGGTTYKGLFMTRNTVSGSAEGNKNWGIAWENANLAVGFPHLDTRTGSAVDSSVSVEANPSDPPDGWYHVVLVWDGVTGTHINYVNGVPTVGTGPVGEISGGIWMIGTDPAFSNRKFDGQIDDVAIWDEPLTEQEILDLYNGVRTPAQIRAPNDTDGDGMPNDYEVQFPGFLDPNVPDADADVDRVGGVIEGAPAPDGLSNAEERLYGTDPRNPDTDGDGLTDGDEIFGLVPTDPLNPDSDNDGIDDLEETTPGADGFVTDPNSPDTDHDALTDAEEIAGGSDPNDPLNPPLPDLPETGLVALYTFDEGTGLTAADKAVADGAQDAMQAEGAIAWNGAGIIGGALDLDGNSYLTAPDALSPSITAFTMTAWILPRSQGTYKGIYSTRDFGGEANLNWGINVESAPLQGDLRFVTGNASMGLDSPAIPLGEWSHLAMTWQTDGVTAIGKAYLNGVLYAVVSNNIATAYNSSGTYYIGHDPAASNRKFDGLIDEISVWNVALSDRQVLRLYNDGRNGIGLPGTSVQMRITSILLNPDGTVTLTWTSHTFAPEVSVFDRPAYAVRYTTDISTPVDNWLDENDFVVSEGATTTYTTFMSFSDMSQVFFMIKRVQ